MSVASVHNLTHVASLVAGNVISLQPTALNICAFALLFFLILLFQPILVHIVAAEELCMHECCILWKSSFFLE